MKCPICNTENPPGATACEQCGFGLSLTQPLWPDADEIDVPDLEETSGPSPPPTKAPPEKAPAAWEGVKQDAKAKPPPEPAPPAKEVPPAKETPDWLASLAPDKEAKSPPPKPEPKTPPWLQSLQETPQAARKPRGSTPVRRLLFLAIVTMLTGVAFVILLVSGGQTEGTQGQPDTESQAQTRVSAAATKEAVQVATLRAPTTATAQAQATATSLAQRARLAGPLEGELEHEPGYVGTQYAGANLADFVAEVRFFNPYDLSEGSWDYGFGFRDTADADEYRLYVNSDGEWTFNRVSRGDGETDFGILASGELSNLDLAAGGSNHLWLEVNGPSASFYVNGEFVASLDVSAKQAHGGLWVGTNFVQGYGVEGCATRFQNFNVWSFIPRPQVTATAQALQATATALIPQASLVYGPAEGELAHEEGDFIPKLDTEVNVRDFIVEARFYNPYDPAEKGWDYGFGFRDTGSDSNYRLYVESSGKWTLDSVTTRGEEADFEEVGGGHWPGLDLSAGGSNHLRLVVQGEAALFFINGAYVSTLDVSARNLFGGVWIGTGFETGHEMLGRSTRYQDFSVWSLDVGKVGKRE